VPAFLGSLPNQGLVGAGGDAQVRDSLPLHHVIPAPAFGRAERQAGDLGQQVAAVAGHLPQFRRPGGFPGFGQVTPAGAPHGYAGNPGRQEPVKVRSGAIMSHQARIEHSDALAQGWPCS
jgi:hypothetical protein